MNEAEWLTCTDPKPMLGFLRGKVSERKLRLFAVACCRRLWHLMLDEPSRTAVAVAERLADGLATNVERRAAATKGFDHTGTDLGWSYGTAGCAVSSRAFHAAERGSGNATLLAADSIAYLVNGSRNPAWQAAVDRESEHQTLLLRDIFNPFRPVTLSPGLLTWHDDLVVSMAQKMYDSRDFSAIPILADALEEAGCTNADILAHCRQPGEHVRGCWVVDLLIGKA